MPFTPLHLGPAIILGYLLRRGIHWPTFIIASILVDVEPLLVFTGLLPVKNYPLHGYLHTFLASLIAGSVLGYVMFLADSLLRNFFEKLHLVEGSTDLKNYILGGVLGWGLHILLDAPLYRDIRPLYPLQLNPFLIPVNFVEPYLDSVYMLLLAGLLLYIAHAYRASSKKYSRPASLMRLGVLTVLSSFILLATLEPASFLIASILAIPGAVLFHRGLTEAINQYKRWVKTFLACVISALVLAVLVQTLTAMMHVIQFHHAMILRDLEVFLDTLALHALEPLFISWALTLIGLTTLYKPVKTLSRNSPNKHLIYSYALLVIGWCLAPLLIGLIIAAIALIMIAVNIPNSVLNNASK